MRKEERPTNDPTSDEKADAFEDHICKLELQCKRVYEIRDILLAFLAAVHGNEAKAFVEQEKSVYEEAESFFHRCSQLTNRNNENLSVCEEALCRLVGAHMQEYEDQVPPDGPREAPLPGPDQARE